MNLEFEITIKRSDGMTIKSPLLMFTVDQYLDVSDRRIAETINDTVHNTLNIAATTLEKTK